MPHARKTGTVWDRTVADYAHTRQLEGTGWAWEFLRRNEQFGRDYRMNRAGHPVAIQHVSGATFYRPRRRFLAAEAWGLELFSNPDLTALETDIFWLPKLRTHAVQCHSGPHNDNAIEAISLANFRGRRAVLMALDGEHVIIQSAGEAASLVVATGTLLWGNSALQFFYDGVCAETRHHESMKILKHQLAQTAYHREFHELHASKYRDYLIALDGSLEGRSLREIAEVLYGKDRVGAQWTDDTRWMKSKVRRAAERGLQLMNGGYRELL